MNTSSEEPTLHELLSRVAALEQANGRLQEELTNLGAERAAAEEQANGQKGTRTRKSSRRKVLEKGLGVAVATVGAGALLELSSGTALASDPAKAGVFASSTAGTPAVKATGSNGADGVDASSNTAGAPAVKATGTNGAHGVDASSDSGIGVFGMSSSGTGVFGDGGTGIGVTGTGGIGVSGSSSGTGVSGSGGSSGTGVSGTSTGGIGVSGSSSGGTGVSATSTSGTGLVATSSTALAGHFVGNVKMDNNLTVTGALSTGTLSSGAGALASSVSGTPAVKATGTNGADGVDASSDAGTGVFGTSTGGIGVHGVSSIARGVFGESITSDGVFGSSQNSTGVHGMGSNGVIGVGSGTGVLGVSSSAQGVFGVSSSGDGVFGSSTTGLAGHFVGNVLVTGTLTKGGGSFKIDHPLDPAHKYLYHSFVESPDMKNIYDGVVTLDANGEAEVRLPDWFDALNTEFRYQLTAIGASAPELYIAEEINGNRFKIAGGKAGMKVSWLVTGIRQDAWANAHRIPVEEDKPAEEQGSYLHPELYGESEQKSLVYGR